MNLLSVLVPYCWSFFFCYCLFSDFSVASVFHWSLCFLLLLHLFIFLMLSFIFKPGFLDYTWVNIIYWSSSEWSEYFLKHLEPVNLPPLDEGCSEHVGVFLHAKAVYETDNLFVFSWAWTQPYTWVWPSRSPGLSQSFSKSPKKILIPQILLLGFFWANAESRKCSYKAIEETPDTLLDPPSSLYQGSTAGQCFLCGSLAFFQLKKIDLENSFPAHHTPPSQNLSFREKQLETGKAV